MPLTPYKLAVSIYPRSAPDTVTLTYYNTCSSQGHQTECIVVVILI